MNFFKDLFGFFFKSRREWLGYKPAERKEGEGDVSWVLWLPLLLFFAYLAWELFWQLK